MRNKELAIEKMLNQTVQTIANDSGLRYFPTLDSRRQRGMVRPDRRSQQRLEKIASVPDDQEAQNPNGLDPGAIRR